MGWLVDVYYALASVLNMLLLYDRFRTYVRPLPGERCRHCGAVLAEVEARKDKTN